MNRSSSAGRGIARPATPQVRRAKVDDNRVGKGPGRKSTAPVDVEPELTRIREEDTDSFDAEEKAARQDTLLEERDVTLKQDSEKTSQKHESEPAEEDLSSGHVRDARGSAKENLEGLYRRQVRAVPKKTEIGQQPQQLRPGAVSGISFIASRHVAAIDGQGELASMVRHGADYKPDQARQNANSRQLWLNAATSTLASDDVMFDPDKEQCHQEQQEVLQRLMLTLLCTRFLKGDQNTKDFSPVLDTQLVSLISSGQRLGLEFDSVETAERFQTFLLTGDEHADLDAVINSRAAKNRKGRSPINKNRPDSPAGIFKRISTHSQKVDKEGFWKEVSATGEGEPME